MIVPCDPNHRKRKAPKGSTFCYGDEIIAVKMEDGSIYVPVRRRCDNLGLVWSGQSEGIQRDEVPNEALMTVRVTQTHISASTRARDTWDMACLPLDLIRGRTCDNLDINWAAQYRRIQRDEIPEQTIDCVVITTTHSDTLHGRPEQEMVRLPRGLSAGRLCDNLDIR
jgi:hypothetical protein